MTVEALSDQNARNSPSSRRWRSGTARSTWRRKSGASRIARCGRRLYAILSKTEGRLQEDDNFPHLVTGKQPHIEDRPPLIYHFNREEGREPSVSTPSRCLPPIRSA